jgi:hypothetical protein
LIQPKSIEKIYIYNFNLDEILMQEEEEEDEDKYLTYSREDIRLLACEMTVKDYDFGICEMMATVRVLILISTSFDHKHSFFLGSVPRVWF